MCARKTNILRSCSVVFLNKRRNAISEILIMTLVIDSSYFFPWGKLVN